MDKDNGFFDEEELLEDPAVKKRRLIIAVVSLIIVVALAFGAATLVKKFVITTYTVSGTSMYPTLNGGGKGELGETLILDKIAKIKRGNIVVFKYDWGMEGPRTLVKRVIGTAGDRIEIKDNVLYVNGEKQTEGYVKDPMIWYDMDITVSDGHIFCMGDNRNDSYDSRSIGEVPVANVIGKCVMILDREGGLRFPKKA